MPIGGPLVEHPPRHCPNNHAWGPPVNGTVRVLAGHRPCFCAAARAAGRHGHRTWTCLKPGCDAEVLIPPCDGETLPRAIHTQPR